MKKPLKESVSVILPCVERNAQLNLPYPKELIKVNEGMSIVDYSFHHILASQIKPRVIVIIGPHKFDTVRYLYEKYNDKVELVFIFKKTDQVGVKTAIRSAKHLLGDKNIFLMPDTIIEYKDKNVPLIDKMLATLDQQPFVFASKNESSVTRLKLFGALRIKKGKVVDYEDKPRKEVSKYNAFWVAYGFRREVFDEVVSVIEKNTFKRPNYRKLFRESPIYNSISITVAEYIDIGTWTNLSAYLLRQYLIKSGIDPQFLKINQ